MGESVFFYPASFPISMKSTSNSRPEGMIQKRLLPGSMKKSDLKFPNGWRGAIRSLLMMVILFFYFGISGPLRVSIIT
jgi:hypothetical protein